MNRLVKQLITPFITEQVKAKKVIAVYPGRFQPFGPHHKKVYDNLKKKFGEVYITTSNIKQPPRHPMNFKEKLRHMVNMGVPKNKIIFEKNPYVANSLLKKFDGEKVAVVYVFGGKDAGRLQGGKKKSGGLTYYQDYNKNKNNMVGYETHGYIYTAPIVKVSGISSGTEIRKLLGSPKVKEEDRKKIFKKTFGYFDQGVYNMLTNKFKKLFEVYSKFIVENKNYIKKLIKEASTGANFPTDDGPPTFYKGFNDYETEAGRWIEEMGKIYGWEVFSFLISDSAQNPEDDYTLKLNVVPSVAFGRENTGEYGKRFGVKKPIKSYMKVADRISKQLGYEVIKYMGIKPDFSGYTGVEVEAPVLPGRYDLGNTKKAELTGKQLGSGMTLLNTLDETIRKDLELIIEDEQFKAKSKETSRTVVYKSKEARDKAIKGGRAEPLDKKTSSKPEKVKGQDLFKKEQDNWERIDNKSNRVKSKDYTDEQYEEETGEYFDNKKTMGVVPNAFKDKNDMIKKMKSARSVYLSSNKMEFMDNTDVGDILKSDNSLELGKQRAKEYGKDWNRLEKAINSGNPVPPPIAMKDKNGDYYLLAGNTRLMSYTASGKKLPIKVIDYDGEFEYPQNETTIKERIDLSEEVQLLIEGGAYGHMSHPFDDNKLTFGDMKKIIKLGLSGELNREDDVTEKTDGQNLMITYRDGKVLAARNKGQIKNRGQNALDTSAVASKFSGRGDIKDTFVFAMKDLSKAIKSLSDKQKDKIFKNGKIFMNLEIIYPKSSNVIDYDKQILQFHNSIEYNDGGNAVGEVKGSGRMLQGMIKQVNQDIGKHFKIIKPKVLALPKKIDFGKKVDIYYKRVNKLQSEFGLKDTDTLGKYHQSYWEDYIYNAGKQFGYTIPKTILEKLTKRWAFFDKSYKISNIKKDLKKQPEFLNWVMNTDKVDHKNMVKKNMLPFEKIFFSVGADILQNLSNFIAANPTKAVEKIRKDILKASNKVRAGGDIKKMKTLKQQLEKLNSIGGLKKIVPVEGVVFKYKGKTYKFTGAFAPVNQILGLVSF